MKIFAPCLLYTFIFGVDGFRVGMLPRQRSMQVRMAGSEQDFEVPKPPPKQKKRLLVDGRNLLFNTRDDDQICFDHFAGEKNTAIMYLPCLNKNKNNEKSSSLEMWCRRFGHPFVCADYYGVAPSTGDFADATVTRWMEDTIQIIEEVLMRVAGYTRVVLVGAGVGGWIMLRVAEKRPDLIGGLVGMAADPDFTEDLLWAQLSEEDKTAIMEKGVHTISWGNAKYRISKNLIEDGRNNLVLRTKNATATDADTGAAAGAGSDEADMITSSSASARISSGGIFLATGASKSKSRAMANSPLAHIECPVRLIHGLSDEEVPYQTALRIAELIGTGDVSVTLVKGGNHYLDDEKNFVRMRKAVEECLDGFIEFDLTTTASG